MFAKTRALRQRMLDDRASLEELDSTIGDGVNNLAKLIHARYIVDCCTRLLSEYGEIIVAPELRTRKLRNMAYENIEYAVMVQGNALVVELTYAELLVGE